MDWSFIFSYPLKNPISVTKTIKRAFYPKKKEDWKRVNKGDCIRKTQHSKWDGLRDLVGVISVSNDSLTLVSTSLKSEDLKIKPRTKGFSLRQKNSITNKLSFTHLYHRKKDLVNLMYEQAKLENEAQR